MSALPKSVASLEVLRNIRAGDLVWVTVRGDVDEEEVHAIHAVVSSAIPEEANLIVTHEGYLKNVHLATLSDLMKLQQTIEKAIQSMVAARSTDE